MQFVVNNCLNSYINEASRMEFGVEFLMKVLDSVLDKPFEDDPQYTCGDFLEELKMSLHDFGEGMKYAKRIVVANATAWSLFPERLHYDNEGDFYYDENASIRSGYVQGYMHDTEK